MVKILEAIANEINPLNDFKEMKFYNVRNCLDNDSGKVDWKGIKQNFAPLLTLPKPLIRGGVIGGTIGAVGGIFSGDCLESFGLGYALGATLDSHQYLLRYFCHYVKAQVFPNQE